MRETRRRRRIKIATQVGGARWRQGRRVFAFVSMKPGQRGEGLAAHDGEYFAGINTSKRFASITLRLNGKMEEKQKEKRRSLQGGFQSMFSFARRVSGRSEACEMRLGGSWFLP